MSTLWIAHKGVAMVDADEDQTELLRRLTDRYGVEEALSVELTKREIGPGMYDLVSRTKSMVHGKGCKCNVCTDPFN